MDGHGLVFLSFDPASLQAAEAGHNRVLVVDQKGSGTYRTVQSAIDAIPANNQQPATIYIKNGVYKEKYCFRKINHTYPLLAKTSTRRFLRMMIQMQAPAVQQTAQAQ